MQIKLVSQCMRHWLEKTPVRMTGAVITNLHLVASKSLASIFKTSSHTAFIVRAWDM